MHILGQIKQIIMFWEFNLCTQANSTSIQTTCSSPLSVY